MFITYIGYRKWLHVWGMIWLYVVFDTYMYVYVDVTSGHLWIMISIPYQ